MANNFKKIIDRAMWVQVSPTPNAHAAGMGIASDLRNDLSRNPFIYQLTSNTVLNRYNAITKAWNFIVSPALAGTFGAGAGAVFAPSQALVGTITTGSTTTKLKTSTVLAAAPGVNMLANRGGSGEYGYRIRVMGKASGKTEERWIVGNTGTTTPDIDVDVAFSFTPANGDTYEILSGRVFMLGAGTLASGSWKSFDVAINVLATKTQTNLPATIGTDFSAIALDEQYVPYNALPGEGLIAGSGTYDTGGTSKKCLVATAIAAGTITGQLSGGDAVVLANEYRNFQIRIVEDTTNPTAVGQRRIIASHTAGTSPIYTLGTNWSVTPSATCKYVIENPNLIILQSSASTSTFTYNYSAATINNGTNSIAADAWSASYFGVAGNAHGAGVVLFPSFGINIDTGGRNSRHSFIYRFRGGASVSLDLLDIAGSITGTWTAGITYDGSGMLSVTTGTCGKYAPCDQEGRFGYINGYVASQVNQVYRFDVKNRVLSPYTSTDWIQAGTAATGDRVATLAAIDGNDRYTMVFLMSHLSTISQELIVQV